MLVSIIIASKNEGDLLRQTIDSIQSSKNNTDYEIVIVDDGSDDDSASFLTIEAYHNIKYIKTDGIGLACARNAGAAEASGDIFIFCDAHIEVPDYWVDILTSVITSENADGVCPCIADLKKDDKSAWYKIDNCINSWSRIDERCGKTIVSLTKSSWLPPQEQAFEVPVLPGGCFAVTRKAFETVRGYENGLRTYGWDEEEISVKLWTFGFVLKAVPQVTIKHYFRAVMPYTVPNQDVLYNLIYLAMCHYSDRRVEILMEELKMVFPKSEYLYQQIFTPQNIQNKRKFYQDKRLYTDDWFFNKFNLQV